MTLKALKFVVLAEAVASWSFPKISVVYKKAEKFGMSFCLLKFKGFVGKIIENWLKKVGGIYLSGGKNGGYFGVLLELFLEILTSAGL